MARRGATAHDGARTSSGGSSPELPEAVARGVVLRRLAMGPRTRAQLWEAVLAKDVPARVAEEVLDRFTEVGLVDDAEFAREWVRIRHRDKGLARRALADELRRKGVEPVLVEAALDGEYGVTGDDEVTAARTLVAKRLPGTRGLDHRRRVNRLVGMLARKGYGPGLAADVVRRALAEENGRGPDEDEGQ